jgi:hypothetical protein
MMPRVRVKLEGGCRSRLSIGFACAACLPSSSLTDRGYSSPGGYCSTFTIWMAAYTQLRWRLVISSRTPRWIMDLNF